MASSSSSSSDVGSGGEDGTLGLAAVGGGGFGGVLIPGLPDDLASLILALLPYAHQVRLRATSRSWHALLSTRLVIHLRRLFRLPHRHVLAVFPDDPAVVRPCLFDPAAAAWALLPPLPPSPHLYGRSNFVPVALGHHLYVIGGSHFDANSYPLNHPTASAAAHRLDLAASRPLSWERLSDMLSPRGSFACASLLRQADDSYGGRVIIVAGGGSRHTMYPSEGSRMCSVEYYDVDSCEWRMGKGLPRYRAGCVGFFVRREEREEEEFWVMGGYGDYHVVGGVVPASVYYRDAVVLGLKSGEWREVEDMWEEGERRKLGKVAAVDVEDGSVRTLFMLDANDIFR